MTLLRTAALTDIGRVRRENEDRLLHDLPYSLFGVADGVGGLPGGGEAAQCAIDEVTGAIHAVADGVLPDYNAIVQVANERVRELGLTLSPIMGIGSTLTFGQIRAGALHVAHVGDSRCYGWRKGELIQLTDDHSVENEARLRRARGEVVYYHESNRNALTRCIGQPGAPVVDLIERNLQPEDRYLFCTDGISRMVRNHELAELVARPLAPDEILQEIVALAIRRGGPDNATGVLIVVDET